MADSYADKAVAIGEQKIMPALQRQIEVHEALAPKANSDAGIWAKPQGEEYYDWALQALAVEEIAIANALDTDAALTDAREYELR